MSDLEQQIQAEQQRLYEISSLTDEMVDEDAQIVLEWASAQLPLLVDSPTEVERKAKDLRRLVQSINYFVGQVESMSPEERQVELQRVYQAADELNYPARQDLIPKLIEQFDGIKSNDVLVILIAWLEDDSLLIDELDG